MHHLIRYAESEGLCALHGDVLAANERMLQMCRELGFDISVDPEDMSLRKVRLTLPLKAHAVARAG
jgi:acetyltransferase